MKKHQRGFLLNPWRFAAAGGTDPYFANVSCLLHLEGADTSTSIVDVKGKAWSALNGAALSTARKPFGGSSVLFDGVNDSVEMDSATADVAFGTGDYTIECWLYSTATTSNQAIIVPNSGHNWGLNKSVGNIFWFDGATKGSTNFPANSWAHVAVCRSSGTSRLFVGGVSTASSWADTLNFSASGRTRCGFASGYSSTGFAGNMKEVRITKGIARYTSNFTPPTGPFPDA